MAQAVGDGMGPLRYFHSFSGLGDLVPNQDGLWIGWLHRPYHVQRTASAFATRRSPPTTRSRFSLRVVDHFRNLSRQ